MIEFNILTPRAHEVIVEGHVTRDEVRAALERMDTLMSTSGTIDVLADVRGDVRIDLSAIGEELRHLPTMKRMLRALDRVALVADRQWLRTVGRIEAALLPGISYEVFDRPDAERARSWLLRRTDVAAVD